jgi:hypothetical protein
MRFQGCQARQCVFVWAALETSRCPKGTIAAAFDLGYSVSTLQDVENIGIFSLWEGDRRGRLFTHAQ